MSQPDYPAFSKKIQSRQWDKYDKRNRRGAYNFEKTKEFELAEKWFEERREAQKVKEELKVNEPKSVNSINVPPGLYPSIVKINNMPPGLEKKAERPKFCKKCTRIPTSTFPISCCNSILCSTCYLEYSSLYNRCVICKTVVEPARYDEFDGLDLCIPSYEDFEYI